MVAHLIATLYLEFINGETKKKKNKIQSFTQAES